MSIGNLKSEGNKSNNFPWQLKMLLGQQCACDQLTQINANTDDVEFLLSAILTTLQASTEYEAKFVVDTCNGDTVYLEVRVWNPDDSTWGPITYYLPGSATPVVPPGAATPGCLQYTDPSGVLGMILAELQLQTPLLTTIDSNVAQLVTNTTSANRTPSIASFTGVGATTAGVYSFSIANVGAADGIIFGVTIPAGMTVNFDGGALNNTLGSISFDATGTRFIITYLS
jgi:hypothetical protein